MSTAGSLRPKVSNSINSCVVGNFTLSEQPTMPAITRGKRPDHRRTLAKRPPRRRSEPSLRVFILPTSHCVHLTDDALVFTYLLDSITMVFHPCTVVQRDVVFLSKRPAFLGYLREPRIIRGYTYPLGILDWLRRWSCLGRLILKSLTPVEDLAEAAADFTRRSAGNSVPSNASRLGETGWLLVATRFRVKGLNTDCNFRSIFALSCAPLGVAARASSRMKLGRSSWLLNGPLLRFFALIIVMSFLMFSKLRFLSFSVSPFVDTVRGPAAFRQSRFRYRGR